MDIAKKLFRLFDKHERKKLIVLLIMMVFAAIFETVSIGVIVPVVGLVTNPNMVTVNKVLSSVYDFLQFESVENFVILTVIALLGVFVLKNSYLILFNYLQNKIVLNQQVKLSAKLFKSYLTKEYSFHLDRNTADLLRNVNGEVARVFQGILLSSFQLFTEILVVIFIFALLITTAFEATLLATLILGSGVLIFLGLFRKKTIRLGNEQQEVVGNMIKWVNQGLGASKEIKVSGRETLFINSYKEVSKIGARNSIILRMLEVIPRYLIETILVGTILITMLTIMFQGSNTSQLISTMALFAMAAFRLMPSISRIVGLVNTIRYSQSALEVIYNDLVEDEVFHLTSTSLDNYEDMKGERFFKNSIKLVDISFRYPGQSNYSIKDVSLTIPIGHAVAFIGESGAGKTTIVDIILGLFRPDNGRVLVDNISLDEQMTIWRSKIGYIPQTIYLSDDTIRGNVAFGIRDELINDKEVWRALEQAQLKDFVERLPEGLNTSVGERGVRLSGGQRQRIGIARALYHNPEILFMDEATSALDNETEKEIMKAIDNLKGYKTLIIIAHRLSTIENCDVVYKMNKGKLVSVENMKVQTLNG